VGRREYIGCVKIYDWARKKILTELFFLFCFGLSMHWGKTWPYMGLLWFGLNNGLKKQKPILCIALLEFCHVSIHIIRHVICHVNSHVAVF
jgi:hypothetical protein